MKKFVGLLACAPVALTFAVPGVAQDAEDTDGAEEVSYRDVLACAALSAVFSASLDDDPEAQAVHDEQGQRLVVMAMNRDGADGDLAIAEFEPTIDKLVEKIESYGEDEAGVEAFLEEGAEVCGGFIAENQAEYDAIDLSEEETVATEPTPPSSDIAR